MNMMLLLFFSQPLSADRSDGAQGNAGKRGGEKKKLGCTINKLAFAGISQAEAKTVFVVVKAGVTSIHHAEIKPSIQSALLLAAAPSRNFSEDLVSCKWTFKVTLSWWDAPPLELSQP